MAEALAGQALKRAALEIERVDDAGAAVPLP
jgi:hypothetical protein